MILLIDNYDSFSYNLYQLLGSYDEDLKVVRNDQLTVSQVADLQPHAIVISPGPGRPSDAGICEELVKAIASISDDAESRALRGIPLLGVCLGHQAICEALGGVVSYAKEIMHGKSSWVAAAQDSVLFRGIDSPFQVARYHSLAAQQMSLPTPLRITAATEDGEIMAVEHTALPVFGVQFHPESILTPDGAHMVQNFLGTIGTTQLPSQHIS